MSFRIPSHGQVPTIRSLSPLVANLATKVSAKLTASIDKINDNPTLNFVDTQNEMKYYTFLVFWMRSPDRICHVKTTWNALLEATEISRSASLL